MRQALQRRAPPSSTGRSKRSCPRAPRARPEGARLCARARPPARPRARPCTSPRTSPRTVLVASVVLLLQRGELAAVVVRQRRPVAGLVLVDVHRPTVASVWVYDHARVVSSHVHANVHAHGHVYAHVRPEHGSAAGTTSVMCARLGGARSHTVNFNLSNWPLAAKAPGMDSKSA